MADEPKLDADGNPIVEPEGDMISITKEEYDTYQQNVGRLDYIEKQGAQFNDQPIAPATPTGPTPEEQLASNLTGINTDIAAIGKQIDEAISGGKPVSDLLAQQNTLNERRVNLQTDFKVADIASQGLNTISQLTSQIVADKMPYLSIPEVKSGYDKTLANMSAAQKASPDAHKIAYDLSCGHNIDKIHEIKIEEANRKQEGDPQVQGNTGGGGAGNVGTSRTPITPAGNEEGNPDFLAHFGQDMIDNITAQGKTPDEWAKRLGYKDAQAYTDFAIEQEKEEGSVQ